MNIKNFKKQLKTKGVEYSTPFLSNNNNIFIKYTEIIIEHRQGDLYIKESTMDKGKIIKNINQTIEYIKEQYETQKYLDEFGNSARSNKIQMSMALSLIWGVISGVIAYFTSDKSPILTGLALGGSIGFTFVMNMLFDKTGYYKYWSKTSKKSWYVILLISVVSFLLTFFLSPFFNFVNELDKDSNIIFSWFVDFISSMIDILFMASFTCFICVAILRFISDKIYFIIEPHIIDKQQNRIGKKYYNSHEYFLPKSLMKNKKLSVNSIVAYLIILEYIDNLMEDKGEYNQETLKIKLPSNIIKKILSISNSELNQIKEELIACNLIVEIINEPSQNHIIVNEFR